MPRRFLRSHSNQSRGSRFRLSGHAGSRRRRAVGRVVQVGDQRWREPSRDESGPFVEQCAASCRSSAGRRASSSCSKTLQEPHAIAAIHNEARELRAIFSKARATMRARIQN
jgi:hypothetical protein